MTSSDAQKDRLRTIVEGFDGRRIVIIGDLVADIYIHGLPERLSREAPVLIVEFEREELMPGGSGNALANVAALGATVVPVCLVGSDATGERLMGRIAQLTSRTEGVLRSEGRVTVTKTRIMAGDSHTRKQQVLRIDRGRRDAAPGRREEERIIAYLDRIGAEVDAVVVCDYGYRLVGDAVREKLAEWGRRGTPVIVDSRYDLMGFGGLTIATPNEGELEAAMRRRFDTVDDALATGEEARSKLDLDALLLTRGDQGMALFERGQQPVVIPICGSEQIVDVTGAGDTVATVLALSLAAGASFTEAARLANAAASVVVMKYGPATVSRRELLDVLDREDI